jgi:tetratricopeptide (TPR) repeat protein
VDHFIRTEIRRLNKQLTRLVARRQYAEALRVAGRICDVIRQYLGEGHPLLAATLASIADLHAATGQYAAAESHLHQALEIRSRALGEEHPSLVPLLIKRGQVCFALGKNADALAAHRRALAIRRIAALPADSTQPIKPAAGSQATLSTRGSGTPLPGESQRAAEVAGMDLEATLPVIGAVTRPGGRGLTLRNLVRRLHRRLRGLRAAAEGVRDWVDCSVFAPPGVVAGETIFVQVFAHRPDQVQWVRRLAAEFDEDTQRRVRKGLETEVQRGSKLMFQLELPGLRIDEPVQGLLWRGRPEAVGFGVTAPGDAVPGAVAGAVTVSLNHVPVGRVRFQLRVVSREAPPPSREMEELGEAAHRYRLAFISYASNDRAEVLKRVSMLRPLGIKYFQDLLDLEPGDRWEKKLYSHIDKCDLFLLFWSSSAKASEWVRKEYRHALTRKGGDDSKPPDIFPVPVEGPRVVEPPEELKPLQFKDRLLYFMQELQEAGQGA